ncbi:MAG: 7-carboxy-7-deazaguanine synthase QueE [Bacteroidetes bacterium]|nr:7-carboxy-7-deazaguanine synthase QueE [Bacteroidota bacterium]
MEEFYSIQGEGFHTGEAAYFIRVGGCDVGCYFCDVKESWDAKLHPAIATDEIVQRALTHPAKAVIVTGGEPLNYNMNYLCEQLKKNGFKTFLETSGSMPLSGKWDWICLSPKQNAPPLTDNIEFADELKAIITKDFDFSWAERYADKVKPGCKLYLQPEWSQRDNIMPLIVDYVMQHPKWQISLQSHKYMRIP